MKKNQFYGVIGAPIAHSLSPRIFELFGEQTGVTLRYEKLTCKPLEFLDALERWRAEGLEGANISLPFKKIITKVCLNLGIEAQEARAVNCITAQEGGWKGDSTDGRGFINASRRAGISFKGKRVLVLGAGGAASSVLAALMSEGVQLLGLYNRTHDRALRIASIHKAVEVYTLETLPLSDWDGIIDATSSTDVVIPKLSAKGAWVHVLNYGYRADAMMKWAGNGGAHLVLDGLPMLVEQAALSYYIWTGLNVETHVVIDKLRQE